MIGEKLDVPECSDGGQTFCSLREVAEQRQLSWVVKVLEVPEKGRNAFL